MYFLLKEQSELLLFMCLTPCINYKSFGFVLWHFQAVSHDDTALTSWSVFQAQLQEWQPIRTEHAQSSSIIFHCWLKQSKPFLYRIEQQSDWHLSEPKVKWREHFCVGWEEEELLPWSHYWKSLFTRLLFSFCRKQNQQVGLHIWWRD